MKILHIAKHCRDANGNVNVAIDRSCAQVAVVHEVVFASDGGILQLCSSSTASTSCGSGRRVARSPRPATSPGWSPSAEASART